MREIFSSVGVFQYSAEAQIIRGRLEAEGIKTFLTDNHTIDTDPLVSNAIGGVKLKVRTEDAKRAMRVLDSISKYSVDDNGEEITCPKCHNTGVELYTSIKGFRSFFFFCISFLINALPIYMRREYNCTHCNYKFELK